MSSDLYSSLVIGTCSTSTIVQGRDLLTLKYDDKFVVRDIGNNKMSKLCIRAPRIWISRVNPHNAVIS